MADIKHCKREVVIKDILEKLFHVNRLTVGDWVLQVLSIMRLDGEIIPTSRCKTLKVEMTSHKRYLPGMEALLDSSPYLEQLIMNVSPHACNGSTICRIKQSVEENYWRTETRIFNCLNKNLRRVEVIGLVPSHPTCCRNRIFVETMHFSVG